MVSLESLLLVREDPVFPPAPVVLVPLDFVVPVDLPVPYPLFAVPFRLFVPPALPEVAEVFLVPPPVLLPYAFRRPVTGADSSASPELSSSTDLAAGSDVRLVELRL